MIKTNNNLYLLQKQKNTSCIIGSNGDIINLLALNNLLTINQNSLETFYENDAMFSFIDFPCFYRSNFSLNKMKNFDNIFMIGTNPRYENSTIQLYLRNMVNENLINIFSLNNYNKLTYKYFTIATTTNFFVNIFEAKDKSLLNFFKQSKNLIINGYNTVNSKNANCNIFQKQFLNSKFYSFTNENNQFLDLSSNLLFLANNEYNSSVNSKSLSNFNIKNKINKFTNVISYESNLNKFQSKNLAHLQIFATFNDLDLLKNNNKQKNIVLITKPNEKNNFVINFAGLFVKSNKITQNQTKNKHNLFFLYKKKFLQVGLLNTFFNKFNNLYKYNASNKNKTLNAFWFLKLFENKNSTKLFFDNTTLMNFFNKNLNKKFFTFWWFNHLVLTNNKMKFFSYTNSIKNYYLSDYSFKNSYNMLLLSLLNQRYNKPF